MTIIHKTYKDSILVNLLSVITPPDFNKILFLEIETVPCQEQYSGLESHLKTLWDKKSGTWKRKDYLLTALESEDLFYQRVGLYVESSKIVAIGIGCLYTRSGQSHLRVKGLAGTEEKVMGYPPSGYPGHVAFW